MNIKDLRDGMRTVEVEGEIVDVSSPREVTLRTGGQARVADATLRDESGTIKLSLWDAQIDAVSKGVKVKVSNGYINTFRGERQLNVGRYGKLESSRRLKRSAFRGQTDRRIFLHRELGDWFGQDWTGVSQGSGFFHRQTYEFRLDNRRQTRCLGSPRLRRTGPVAEEARRQFYTTLTEGPLPKEFLDGTGMASLHVQMFDHAPPSQEALSKAVQHLSTEIEKGNVVVVHCLAGQGRTGSVLAAYMIEHEGKGVDEAISQLRKSRPGSVERSQEGSVREYAQSLKQAKRQR